MANSVCVPIRVVFDAHGITKFRSGIGEYSYHVCKAMLEYESERVQLFLYTAERIFRLSKLSDIESTTARNDHGTLYSLRHQFKLPLLLRSGRYDLFHSPDFVTPLLNFSIPMVCTIHDLVPLVFPHYLGKSRKTKFLPLYKAFVQSSAFRSRRIVTDSEFSKQEIVRLLSVRAEKIEVIPLAPVLDVEEEKSEAAIALHLQDKPYFVYIGRHDPYKGIDTMLRAFHEFIQRNPGTSQRLIIIGSHDDRYPITPLLHELKMEMRVVLTGYLSRMVLSTTLRNATALIMPSLYEGFGLPPLEAMESGVPVLCSNRASLPEVVGDAALTFDPDNRSAFVQALTAISSNSRLRKTLKDKGQARAAQFSWQKTAKRTVDVYESVIQTRRK